MANFPKQGELTIGQREARQPGKTKRRRVNAYNAVRSCEAHMRCFDGGIDHDGWVRAKDCPFCAAKLKWAETCTEAAHAVARGMGAANGKWYDLFPACREHHSEQGRRGNAHMAHRYGVDPENLAQRLAAEHLRELGAIA